MACNRFSRADQRSRITCPTGTIIAPAAPWAMRANDNCSSEAEKAQATDARVNSTMALTNTRRGPKRSAAQPLTGTNNATASRYSDTTRFIRTLGSLKSLAICGNAVSTAVASINSMNSAQPMIIGTLFPLPVAIVGGGTSEQSRGRRWCAFKMPGPHCCGFPVPWVVVDDSACVAPVTVKIMPATRGGGTAHIEHQFGGLECRLRCDVLRLGHFHGGLIHCQRVEVCRPGPVNGFCGAQHHRLGRVGTGGNVADAQFHIGIIHRAGGGAVLDGPGMITGKSHRVVQGVAGNAGLDRREEQLQERRDDGALALLHGPGTDLRSAEH